MLNVGSNKTRAVMLMKVSNSWITLQPIVQEILKQVQDDGKLQDDV